jgi:hypothetical protein
MSCDVHSGVVLCVYRNGPFSGHCRQCWNSGSGCILQHNTISLNALKLKQIQTITDSISHFLKYVTIYDCHYNPQVWWKVQQNKPGNIENIHIPIRSVSYKPTSIISYSQPLNDKSWMETLVSNDKFRYFYNTTVCCGFVRIRSVNRQELRKCATLMKVSIKLAYRMYSKPKCPMRIFSKSALIL